MEKIQGFLNQPMWRRSFAKNLVAIEHFTTFSGKKYRTGQPVDIGSSFLAQRYYRRRKVGPANHPWTLRKINQYLKMNPNKKQWKPNPLIEEEQSKQTPIPTVEDVKRHMEQIPEKQPIQKKSNNPPKNISKNQNQKSKGGKK